MAHYYVLIRILLYISNKNNKPTRNSINIDKHSELTILNFIHEDIIIYLIFRI